MTSPASYRTRDYEGHELSFVTTTARRPARS